MIIALSCGRKGSKGFPGKNLYKLGSYPIMAYPIMAANKCSLVDKVYFSSDCKEQMLAAILYGVDETFKRPDHLASDSALLEDVYVWLFNKVRSNIPIEFVVLLMSNAPGINSKMMEEMILILRENEKADSICTVSKYLEYSPYRMRKIKDDWLVNWEDCNDEITCDRNSGDPCYIYDCSCAVVRPDCLDYIHEGIPPQKWLGKKILPYNKYRDVPCLDIDSPWQVPQMESWLEKYW